MNFSNFFSLPTDSDDDDAFDHQVPGAFCNQPTLSVGFGLNPTASGYLNLTQGAQRMVQNSFVGAFANNLGPIGNLPEYGNASNTSHKQNLVFNQGPSFSSGHFHNVEKGKQNLVSKPLAIECNQKHQSKSLEEQKSHNIHPKIFQVDINFASKEKLSEIPGINHAMAYHIVDYRQRYGPYRSFDVLKGIGGIGEFELAAIKDHCVIDPSFLADDFNIKNQSTAYSSVSHQGSNYEKPVANLIYNYISVGQFQACNVKPQSLLFVHVQINGLLWNISKIEKLISSCRHKPDVICVSETKSTSFDKKFNLPSYTFVQVNSKFPSDGVAIYAKSSLLCKERKDLNCSLTDCEDTWIEIVRQRDMKNIVVGAVCRHHELGKRKEFIKDLKALIQKVAYSENKVIYILGDINVDWLSSNSDVKAFREDMLTLGCKQLISKPTKKRGIKSLKNPILTNDFIHHDVQAGIVETTNISNQYPVYCIV